MTQVNSELRIEYVKVDELKPAEYNPRKWTKEATLQLQESIKRYGIVDPILVNSAPERKNIVIGGNFRTKVLKDLGYETVPVVCINIPELEKEKELCIRLKIGRASCRERV